MRHSVVIVGAGPAGAVLAYLLAKSGICVTLLERHVDFQREFRGEILMPSGLEPLSQIGLWNQMKQVPHVSLEGIKVFINGRQGISLDFHEQLFGEFNPRWVSQPHLLEMIVGECARFDNFKLLRGTRVRDLIKENNRIVGVIAEQNQARHELRADLVIGADGRTSRVRHALNLPQRSDAMPMDIVWLKVPGPPFLEPKIRAYAGKGRLLFAAPTYDNHLQLGFIIRKGSFRKIRERGYPELLDEMARFVDPVLGAHLAQFRDSISNPFLLSTVSDCLVDWTYPGSFLIGDAAHTMSPVGGQGLNIAIRDAIVSANHLIPVLSSDRPLTLLEQTTRLIQAQRNEEVNTIQKIQALPPKVLLRDTWWSRLLFYILLKVTQGRSKTVKTIDKQGMFGKFTSGVTEVVWLDP